MGCYPIYLPTCLFQIKILFQIKLVKRTMSEAVPIWENYFLSVNTDTGVHFKAVWRFCVFIILA